MEEPSKCENGLRFAPLSILRFFMGRCYYREHDFCARIYCRFMHARMVAFQRSSGNWYIRRKYRWIFSSGYILHVVEKRNRKVAAGKTVTPEMEDIRG